MRRYLVHRRCCWLGFESLSGLTFVCDDRAARRSTLQSNQHVLATVAQRYERLAPNRKGAGSIRLVPPFLACGVVFAHRVQGTNCVLREILVHPRDRKQRVATTQ